MEVVDLVKSYLETHNAHDIDRAVSLLSEDVIFETVGVWIKRGQDKVRELEEWDAALGSSLAFTGLAAEGNQVKCQATERNAWFRLAGIDEVYYDSCVFTLARERLPRYRRD